MSPLSTSPRIRRDLAATPVEADGARYVDVERPDNGLMMRMFEHEWELAQRMDGATTWDDLSAWARIQLKKQITVDELAVLAARMETAGFFEKDPAPAPAPEPEPVAAAPPAEPAPAPVEPAPVAAPVVVEAAKTDPNREPSGRADPAKLAALAQSLKQKEKPKNDELKQFFKQPVKEAEEPEPPRRRGPNISSALLSGIGICAVLMALPLLVYHTFMKPAPAWKVQTRPAEARDLVELYEGAEGAIRQSSPVPVGFTVAGTVGTVAAEGTAVKAGDTVASLAEKAAASEALEKLKRRLEHYTKQKDPKKVAEKQKLIAAAEAHLAALDLKVPASFAGGRVVQVLAPPGTAVTAGQPVVSLGDPSKRADLAVPDPTDFRPGMPVEVQSGATFLKGKVDKIEGGKIAVELDGGAIGDPVRLVKRHAVGIVDVPSSAVVLRGGISTVFVLEGERVRARKVNVLERTLTEAKISSGLKGGEAIVTAPPETMQDDEQATLVQGGPK